MTRRTLIPLIVAALVAWPGSGRAQEPSKPEAPKAETAKPDAAKPETAKAEPTKPDSSSERRGPQGVNLRIQLVITRFQGERKVASLPYTFVVTTGGGRARMRMGVDTPVPVASFSPSDNAKPTTSFQYRNVGTNIDCAAFDRGEGRYQVNIGVENSSALQGASGSGEGSAPLFRRFDTNFDPWLRDGQSVQTIASTDPVTGEVVKIDVTLNVVK